MDPRSDSPAKSDHDAERYMCVIHVQFFFVFCPSGKKKGKALQERNKKIKCVCNILIFAVWVFLMKGDGNFTL